jgi:hypothetical protein
MPSGIAASTLRFQSLAPSAPRVMVPSCTHASAKTTASKILDGITWHVRLANALVQLQAQYNHCGEAASEKCLSAATFVIPHALQSLIHVNFEAG